jgi:hypothetical protein
MDRTNAERQRRYIARLKAKAAAGDGATNADEAAAALAKATARIAKLEAELAAKNQEIAGLRTTLGVLEQEVRKLRAAKPKVEKAPPPPDEARDRKIEAQKKTIRELRERIPSLTSSIATPPITRCRPTPQETGIQRTFPVGADGRSFWGGVVWGGGTSKSPALPRAGGTRHPAPVYSEPDRAQRESRISPIASFPWASQTRDWPWDGATEQRFCLQYQR